MPVCIMGKNTKNIAFSGILAALYVALTLISEAIGLASGMIQLRLSEALTIMPFFTPAAIPGLTVGCFLANILTTGNAFDIVFGTVATALGAIGTFLLSRKLKKKGAPLCTLPPVITNVIIIPPVLKYAYGMPNRILTLMLFVGIGELASCCLLGGILFHALRKSPLFRN